jgi:hypothetical protein
MIPVRVAIRNKRGQDIAVMKLPNADIYSAESVKISLDGRPSKSIFIHVHESPELGVMITCKDGKGVSKQFTVFEREENNGL